MWSDKQGELIRKEFEEEVFFEREGWAVEKVNRVSDRLGAGTGGRRFQVLVPWLAAHSAFTTFGRYIYISRRLLERCRTDEVVAMIIAHEMAHHELGHLDVGRSRFWPLGVLRLHVEKKMNSQAHELAADRRAIEICLEAGYSPTKCLDLFRMLIMEWLNQIPAECPWHLILPEICRNIGGLLNLAELGKTQFGELMKVTSVLI